LYIVTVGVVVVAAVVVVVVDVADKVPVVVLEVVSF